MTFDPTRFPQKDPAKVSRDFDRRHGGPGSKPSTFMWAVWAAEGSDYLEKLDDEAFTWRRYMARQPAHRRS